MTVSVRKFFCILVLALLVAAGWTVAPQNAVSSSSTDCLSPNLRAQKRVVSTDLLVPTLQYSVPANIWSMPGDVNVMLAQTVMRQIWNALPFDPVLDPAFSVILQSKSFARAGNISQGVLSVHFETEKRLHHITEVFKVAAAVAERLNARGIPVSTKKLLMMVLIHDLAHPALGHLGEKKSGYAAPGETLEASYRHNYSHGEQGDLMTRVVLGAQGNVPPLLINDIAVAIRNHSKKSSLVSDPDHSIYGSIEGALLMFCDAIANHGSDLRRALWYGFVDFGTLAELHKTMPELIGFVLARGADNLDEIGEAIDEFFIRDLVANTTPWRVGYSPRMQEIKDEFGKFILNQFIFKLRRENNYAFWAFGIQRVLADVPENQQIRFLRTISDRELQALIIRRFGHLVPHESVFLFRGFSIPDRIFQFTGSALEAVVNARHDLGKSA